VDLKQVLCLCGECSTRLVVKERVARPLATANAPIPSPYAKEIAMTRRLDDVQNGSLQAKPDAQAHLVPHAAASRGLAAAFGLDFRAALLTVIVDLMVFGMDTVSLEALLPLGMFIAAGLGVVVYRIQREYGDDRQRATTKAFLIALLTAIPVPLSPVIAVPAGVVGIVSRITRR
jgi:hypothetical protein